MAEEPKKISFGFSKVSKKNNIIQPIKDTVAQSDVQFIDCLEEKSIKLVSGEDEKKKELPIIPMLNGNLLRESIKEVAKSRIRNKHTDNNEDSSSKEKNNEKKEPLTIDELATKEILEDLKKSDDQKPEKALPAVPLDTQVTLPDKEPSSLEDYESMPIADFGLAMLRGMGWDPRKGIGLNEKLVTPLAPALRPKGMGLGADKVPITKNVASNGELLIMKKGAPVKIICGPHNNSFGKIEGFDELPGRLMVRLALSNIIISINEIMVQLISFGEYKQCVNNAQDKSDKSPVDTERYKNEENKSKKITEKKSITSKENYGLIYSKDRRKSEEKEKEIEENFKIEKKSTRNELYERISKRHVSSNPNSKRRKKNYERYGSSSSSEHSSSSYRQVEAIRGEKKYKSRNKDSNYKNNYKRSSTSYSNANYSSSSSRSKKKSSIRRKYDCSSSSETDSGKRAGKGNRDSHSSDSYEKASYSRKYRKDTR